MTAREIWRENEASVRQFAEAISAHKAACRGLPASVDTRPKGGDSPQSEAPALPGSAVAESETPQPPRSPPLT